MTDSKAFNRTQFYVAIGKCVIPDYCCVFVDNVLPPQVMKPVNGRTYITMVVFDFLAPKKVPYAMIISNLRCAGIFPDGKSELFNHPTNPDNKFYTELPFSHIHKIIHVIRKSIEPMTIGEDLEPHYIETHINADAVEIAIRKNQPSLTLDSPVVVLLDTGDRTVPYDIHKFYENQQ